MKNLLVRVSNVKRLYHVPVAGFIAACVTMLITQVLCADVIFFKSGKMEQGYVETKGSKYCVRDRVGSGEVEFYTGIVKNIEYGIWFEDLDPKVRSQVMTSVITNQPVAQDIAPTVVTANWNIVETPPEQFDVSALIEDVNPAFLWSLGSGVVVLFILSIVSFVCSIIVLVDAFRRSIWWGLGYLFIPFVSLYYLIFEYNGNKARMFFWIFSPFIFGVLWWFIMNTYFPQGG